MFADIVIPDGNEKEFIDMAKRLGYSSLVFAYPFGSKISDIKDNIKDNIKDRKINVTYAILIEKKHLAKVQSIKGLVIAKAEADNRAFFESKKIDIIYGLEQASRKDYIHHRGSGMNQVLAKLAKQNKKSIAFSFSMLLKRKAEIMARIGQNIRLCRKYDVCMVIASFAKKPYDMRSPHDLIALMQSLGMEGGEAKKALEKFK